MVGDNRKWDISPRAKRSLIHGDMISSVPPRQALFVSIWGLLPWGTDSRRNERQSNGYSCGQGEDS